MYLSVCYVCLHLSVHIYMFTGSCGDEEVILNVFLYFSPTYVSERVFHSNLEAADLPSLGSQLALGISCLSLLYNR